MTLDAALRAVVGEPNFIVDASVIGSYRTDWTGRFSGSPRCVVRPADTGQVASVVSECAAAGAPITIQGGNTGLVGGAVPADGSVLLSTRRLGGIEDFDSLAGQVTVGCGVVLAALQRQVRPGGFDFGVDFAARDSCTLGGMAAANAGGERVLRYGTMRAQLAGVEAVLADGSVISRLAGLAKDNSGYDLTGLLCGSEGTLGVITRLRLRLIRLLDARAVAMIAVEDTQAALAVLGGLRARLPSLEAAELFFADGLELVCGQGNLPAPFARRHPAYVLVECADLTDPGDALLAALADIDAVRDATVGADAGTRRALWAYRERHTEALNTVGPPVKLDVAVPLPSLARLVAELPGTVSAAAPAARAVVFGHLAEGNLHINLLDALARADEVTDAVLQLVARLGGSVSAEHGIGRAKARWLHLSRTATEIAAMRTVKRALDPQGLLNRGVLLDAAAPS